MAIRCRFALALALATASASVPAQEAGRWDAGQAWETFIAKATSKDVTTALAVLDAVDYTPLSVDAAKCRDNARQVAQAQLLAPVSLAVQRAALLCAEATGDDAAAERATVIIAALARHRAPIFHSTAACCGVASSIRRAALPGIHTSSRDSGPLPAEVKRPVGVRPGKVS